MFIGRNKELNEIIQQLSLNKGSAILIYGKRRIGKSFLINEAIKRLDCKTIYYECINASLNENLLNFEKRIKTVFNNQYLHFSSFQEAFDYLNGLSEKIVVVLDEYSYLKSSSNGKYIDSVFQSIIDSLSDNVSIVLLGSYVGIMRELLAEESPLFGRFSLILHVQEFDYLTASGFYPEMSVKDKISFYSVFGGSPFVNSFINQHDDLKQNVKKLLLNENSAIRTYLENVLLNELSKTGPANLILSAISNGRKKYTEISSMAGINTPGILDKQLKNLISMDVLTRLTPVNKRNDRKKVFYEISDNLVRFYYYYIFSR